jgi:hypothetical protein
MSLAGEKLAAPLLLHLGVAKASLLEQLGMALRLGMQVIAALAPHLERS